jgi:prevent-host-death family protein
MRVNVLEAKNRLSQLIKAAQAGEEVVIANRGTPVARLVQIENAARPDRDFLRWLMENPLPAYGQRTASEIDSTIAEERNAWG